MPNTFVPQPAFTVWVFDRPRVFRACALNTNDDNRKRVILRVLSNKSLGCKSPEAAVRDGRLSAHQRSRLSNESYKRSPSWCPYQLVPQFYCLTQIGFRMLTVKIRSSLNELVRRRSKIKLSMNLWTARVGTTYCSKLRGLRVCSQIAWISVELRLNTGARKKMQIKCLILKQK